MRMRGGTGQGLYSVARVYMTEVKANFFRVRWPDLVYHGSGRVSFSKNYFSMTFPPSACLLRIRLKVMFSGCRVCVHRWHQM
jgi:hypothetical protein